MSKELIHLASGEDVRAEVSGKTLDGQRGYAFLAANTGNLYHTLRESAEIEVVKQPDGSWREVRQS